jgi:hypothetical protein
MSKLYKHHIVPKHAGGSDDLSNIKMVTLEQHAEEHRLLWEKYQLYEDFIAWKCLSGQIPKEEIARELNVMNGKRQGKKNAESGFMKKIQKMNDHITSGKLGSEISKQKKTNAFYNEKLRKESSRKGGVAQGKINAESGHLQKIAGMGSKDRIWINKDSKNKRVKLEHFNEYLQQGWTKGIFKN